MADENVFEKAIDEVKTLVHDAETKIESIIHPVVPAPVAQVVNPVPTDLTPVASVATGAAVEGAASGTSESPIESEVSTIETAIKSTPETLLKQMFVEFEGIPAMGKAEIQAMVTKFKALYDKL